MRNARISVLAVMMTGAVACGAPPVTPSSSPAGKISALPELLAVAACPQVDGRALSLATGDDGVLDAFAWVRTCTAHSASREVALTGDAWVWVAVDRELGGVRVRQFVHASLHATSTLGVAARYQGEHLELAVTPRPGAEVSVEPVGALVVSPLNWASLLAVELAPAAGTSVEWVAKRKLQKETERALQEALERPLVFAYDARRGESLATAPVASAASSAKAAALPGTRVRVVPRGTALLGPYPEGTSPPAIALSLPPGARVAYRAVCRSHAERLLEADRRGDVVGLEDWAVATGDEHPALAPPPCPWHLALRAVDDGGAVVRVVTTPGRGDTGARERDHRWIALDALELVGEGLPVDQQIVLSTDVFRRSVVPRSRQSWPVLFELSGDESAWLRAVRPGKDPAHPTVVLRGRVPLDRVREVDEDVELVPVEPGAAPARVHVKARVREAP